MYNEDSRFTLSKHIGCRPAIAWATWDLIAMVETGAHDGPATHAVTFVWNGHEVINLIISRACWWCPQLLLWITKSAVKLNTDFMLHFLLGRSWFLERMLRTPRCSVVLFHVCFKWGCLLLSISYDFFKQGEDVYLVGDFTGNWKEPIKAVHKGGPRFEAEVRLSQGK